MLARVFVTLKQGVLDPQGQAVQRSLGRLGFNEVTEARIGKYIELTVDGNRADIEARLHNMCKELLANTVIEDYRFELVETAKSR
jgi:phosphoribosylformylglycinamidine synthase